MISDSDRSEGRAAARALREAINYMPASTVSERARRDRWEIALAGLSVDDELVERRRRTDELTDWSFRAGLQEGMSRRFAMRHLLLAFVAGLFLAVVIRGWVA